MSLSTHSGRSPESDLIRLQVTDSCRPADRGMISGADRSLGRSRIDLTVPNTRPQIVRRLVERRSQDDRDSSPAVNGSLAGEHNGPVALSNSRGSARYTPHMVNRTDTSD